MPKDELRRIADALERIADALGAEPKPEFTSAYENHGLETV